MRSALSVFAAFVASFTLLPAQPAKATSYAECAIWLCLPSGFPAGCGAAHSAFTKRIKRGKSPLPEFSNCAVGKSTGSYQAGYERLETCRTGYEERRRYFADGHYHDNVCVTENCYSTVTGKKCDYYVRQRRTEPHFIKMWIDDKYQGTYWW